MERKKIMKISMNPPQLGIEVQVYTNRYADYVITTTSEKQSISNKIHVEP